jgi:hypothetical protein
VQRKRPIIIGAAAVAAALMMPTAAAQAAPPTQPFYAFTVDGNGTSPLAGAGTTANFSGASAVALAAGASGSFAINAGAWSAAITPETGGTTIDAGTYSTALTADASDIGFALTNGSAACATETGSLVIDHITYDAGAVTELTAEFATSCNGSAAVSGVLRYDSSADYLAATQSAASEVFSVQDIGIPQTRTLTVSSVGSSPLALQAATISGTGEDAFTITADTCSSKSIAGGSSCTIGIISNPLIVGLAKATLTIPDNTTVGNRVVALSVNGNDTPVGTYMPLSPARILDTRYGTDAPKAAVGPGGIIHVQVTGHGGVPSSGVSAVVLNVTETSSTKGGYLTVYPTGVTRPTSSNLNFTSGSTRANSVTVQVGSTGGVDIYNATGSVQLIGDVFGYFVGHDGQPFGGQYHAFKTPDRVIDTRGNPLTVDEAEWAGLNFNGTDGVDYNSHIRAFAVNITVVGPKAAGYVTAWDGASWDDLPNTSTLNFAKGATVPNMAIVPTSPCTGLGIKCQPGWGDDPFIAVDNGSSNNIDLLIDVVGYFDDGTLSYGMRFHPITPTRITDSRGGLGVAHAIGSGQTVKDNAPASVADDLTGALALNVTAVAPTASTYLTFWPDNAGSARPNTSTLNPAKNQTVANAAIITMGDTENAFDIFNAAGTTNVLVDVAGFYEIYPLTAGITAKSPLGTTPNKAVPTGKPVVGGSATAQR